MNVRRVEIILDALYDSTVSAKIEKSLIDNGLNPAQPVDRIPFGKPLREAALLWPKEFKEAVRTFITMGR